MELAAVLAAFHANGGRNPVVIKNFSQKNFACCTFNRYFDCILAFINAGGWLSGGIGQPLGGAAVLGGGVYGKERMG